MQLDEMTPVLPDRNWDDLVTTSMRRGRRLRRRRQAAFASPIAAVMALIVAIPLSGVFDRSHDGLARLHTTNVGPAQSSAPSPGPSSSASPGPVQHVTPAPGTLQVSPASVGPGRAHAEGPGPLAPQAVSSAARRATGAVPPVTLSYDDPQGDATPQAGPNAPATPSASATSDPTLDVVRMSFTVDRSALRIAMSLLGDYRTDGYYLAYFSDSRTGCAYTVLLGGGYHDQIWWTCGSTTGADFLQGTPDSSRTLNAAVPLASLPGGARPHDTFAALKGETRLVHAADGQWPYDEAATAKTLRLP